MRNPALVQVMGPLAPFAKGFRVRLEVLGYAREPRVVHLELMAPVSCWLDERGLDGSALSTQAVEEFVRDRQAAGHHNARSILSLRPLVEYLREVGAAPLPVRQPAVGPVEALPADFARYLAHERGLAAVTIGCSTDLVRPFVTARVSAAGLDLETLSAADVIAFMLARSANASPATVQRTGAALRSLLRFLHLQGLIDNSLVGAVPTASNWKLGWRTSTGNAERSPCTARATGTNACSCIFPRSPRSRAIEVR